MDETFLTSKLSQIKQRVISKLFEATLSVRQSAGGLVCWLASFPSVIISYKRVFTSMLLS